MGWSFNVTLVQAAIGDDFGIWHPAHPANPLNPLNPLSPISPLNPVSPLHPDSPPDRDSVPPKQSPEDPCFLLGKAGPDADISHPRLLDRCLTTVKSRKGSYKAGRGIFTATNQLEATRFLPTFRKYQLARERYDAVGGPGNPPSDKLLAERNLVQAEGDWQAVVAERAKFNAEMAAARALADRAERELMTPGLRNTQMAPQDPAPLDPRPTAPPPSDAEADGEAYHYLFERINPALPPISTP